MDAKTIAAARAGSRRAQAELLRALQDPWYRMCLSLLRDPEAARDATQETGLRFLQAIGGFRGDSQLTTWSMGICINVAREMRRKDRPLPEMKIAEEAGRREEPPEASVERSEECGMVRQLLAELPERQQEAILLRFFEAMSVEEAAEAMACAPGTIKATVHQALRALKKKLTKEVV